MLVAWSRSRVEASVDHRGRDSSVNGRLINKLSDAL